MGTPTPKMNMTKPTVGGDTNWGTLVNGNFDIIDNLAGYNTVSASISGSLAVGIGPTLVKATGGVGGITLTLPDATVAANSGRVFIVVKVDAGAGAITINTTGGQTINGNATASIAAQWDTLSLQADGANWIIINPLSVSGSFVSLAPTADQTITGTYKLILSTGVLVAGGGCFSTQTVTTTYSATQYDFNLIANGTFTITLPSGLTNGQTYRIKNVGTGTITIAAAANIDGAASITIPTQYQSVDLVWDGTTWWTF